MFERGVSDQGVRTSNRLSVSARRVATSCDLDDAESDSK